MMNEIIRFLMAISLIMTIVFAVVANLDKCVFKSLIFTLGSVFFFFFTVLLFLLYFFIYLI